MSRIFEALQRSESERAEFSFPEPATIAAAEMQETEKEGEKETAKFGSFPSVRVVLSPDTRLVSLVEKEGLGAEKFRFLGVRLRQMQQVRGIKRVAITSTLPEEGKSMVSANLAVTLARRKQQKVLLLEGDLRRPVHAERFGAGRLPGLSEWLQSDGKGSSNIYFLEEAGFWLMPGGRPPENPLELMQSGRFAELIARVESWFDWVLIDCPPVLPLADTSVLTRFADGVLLVVREGRTEKKQLERGLAALDHSRLLGAVVNNCTNTDYEDYYSRYNAGIPPSLPENRAASGNGPQKKKQQNEIRQATL